MSEPSPKFWLLYAVEDDPLVCKSFDSAVDIAVAAREIIENNKDRYVYMFSFYGQRLSITKGPERYLVVPHHNPTHYPLFARSGEINDVDAKDGVICDGPDLQPDPSYKQLTSGLDRFIDETAKEEEMRDEDDELTEPESAQKYH